ncbi:MAG: PAS domain S-box protein [Bacteroidetes bacterium]|nr:PAS domain S-box protein [Bacteroidota bacterium]
MLAILGAVLGVYLIRTQAIRTQNKRLEEANTKLSVNIAERKAIEVALREGEERYRAFVANSSEGIWRTEMDEPFSVDLPEDEQIECLRRGSRLAESNDAFAKMYGYETADQVIGKPIMEFVLLSKPENVDFLRAYIRSGYRVVDAVSHEATRDGTEKYISNSFVGIVEDGLYRGAWGTQRDITDRRQAEKEREHLISGLEAKNRELERFTYTVSHDLKSPLITIKGFLGLLSKDARAGNIERMEEDIELIGTAADQMHQLLAELLELSRIGRLMNPPTAVSLTDLAREAVEMLAGRIGERGARVEIAEDMPVVEGDRLRLLEVYQNLIDNAIKFMDTQPQPSVEIGATVNGEQVRCYVRDNGIGIDPKYHEKIFGLFDQLKANQEGTGIGLALVKRIIEVHGGQIWVESEGDGQGSTFWFTLPRSAAGTL